VNPYKPKVKVLDPFLGKRTLKILRSNFINTVCEESLCPNRAQCYAAGNATFMILGKICTRACKFCNIKTSKPSLPDENEPQRVAKVVKELNLRYVVITSVDRDDLKDYGSLQFQKCVLEIRKTVPSVKIELLTPDFRENKEALKRIVSLNVEKLAHNEETVRRLSPLVRPQSDYDRSLRVLEYYAKNFNGRVKSSLMVGLGESEKEIEETLKDLLNSGVCEVTIGQYLSPSSSHYPVKRYYPKEFFDYIKKEAVSMGFKSVAAGILVRSSYFAEYL